MPDSDYPPSACATHQWDELTRSHYGVVQAADGMPLWVCEHDHFGPQEAAECAEAELAEREEETR